MHPRNTPVECTQVYGYHNCNCPQHSTNTRPVPDFASDAGHPRLQLTNPNTVWNSYSPALSETTGARQGHPVPRCPHTATVCINAATWPSAFRGHRKRSALLHHSPHMAFRLTDHLRLRGLDLQGGRLGQPAFRLAQDDVCERPAPTDLGNWSAGAGDIKQSPVAVITCGVVARSGAASVRPPLTSLQPPTLHPPANPQAGQRSPAGLPKRG